MNKKFAILLSSLSMVACSFICACNNGSTPEEPEIIRTTFYFNSQNEELFIGDTFKLEPEGYVSKTGLTWISSNASIVSVDNGLITALALGDAVISAYDDYAIAKCSVSVIKHDENFFVTLSQDEIILNKNDSFVVISTFQNNEGPIDATFTVAPFSEGASKVATYELKNGQHTFTAVESGECVYSFTTTYNEHSYGANLTITVN